MDLKTWEIAGSDGEPIIGNSHLPDDESPRGVVVISHGFKGYKDYGMFPWLANQAARAGFIAHRFNFSHSGMTEHLDTFERPDLFERDTYNRQVFDCRAVLRAIADGILPGRGSPAVLFGHSRGGVSILLTASRHAREEELKHVVGLCTAASPSSTSNLSKEESAALLREGFLSSPSARTGQNLRLGAAWLKEQIDDPKAHDLLALIATITLPILVIHGSDDPTVEVECAARIAGAARNADSAIISGADHVFNTPNPFPADAEPSSALAQLAVAFLGFASTCCEPDDRAAR